MPPPKEKPELLTPPEVATRLRVPVQRLADWRVRRVGPPFIKVGRSVRYAHEAIVAYLEENTIVTEK